LFRVVFGVNWIIEIELKYMSSIHPGVFVPASAKESFLNSRVDVRSGSMLE
jgi:hypothetical protein